MTKEYMELFLAELSKGFYIRQVLVIVGLFLLGFICLQICGETMEQKWKYLLAFPMGLALWCVICFLILTLGIPLSIISIGIVMVFGMALLFWSGHQERKTKEKEGEPIGSWKPFLVVFCGVCVVACVATSGLLSFSVSNDTMYYYMYYPEVLVSKGAYVTSFDTFLSDVGPMAAIIGMLPTFFGFDQIYGIHQFFNINFIIIFAVVIYECARMKLSQKTSVVTAVIGAVILSVSTPYLVISKWILANAYIMYYSFILFYLAYKYSPTNDEIGKKRNWFPVVFFVLIGMISMLRMEGCVVACFIVICMSTLHYSNKQLVYVAMLPTLLFPILYYIRYFLFLKMSPLYSFLTWQKAVLIICAMLILLSYLLFIRGKRLKKLQSRMRLLLVLAMFLGNGILFLFAPSHYMVVIQAFCENTNGRQGWGYTIELIVICYLVTSLLSLILIGFRLQHRDIAYEDFIFVGFLFVLFAVSYARGGGLRYGIGDSGNRVLMQIIPIAWYALICKAIHLMKELNNANSG